MEFLKSILDVILHLKEHLVYITDVYGGWTYLILFLVIFAETGLVITPFLPGDSLLFAAGSLAALGSLNVHLTAGLLLIAAILGDAVNYHIGRYLGLGVFKPGDPGFIRKYFLKMDYLKRTQAFYEKYGGKTIIIARFVPIVRTFAPFLAGVGTMSYSRFVTYNVVGAILWVYSLTYAGYFFGNIEIVRNNFELVIFGIIGVSFLPVIIEIISARSQNKQNSLGSETGAN